MPNWNYGMFLSDCIQSLLEQTVRPAKIIISDDASSDNSPNILRGYDLALPGMFHIILRDDNVGIIKNENEAVEHVDTEWMFFMDPDDLLHPQYIEKVLDVIDRQDNEKLMVVYSDMKKIGNWEGDWVVSDWDPVGLRTGNYINGHSVFRTELFRQVGGLKDNGNFEDHQLWVDMLDLDPEHYGVRIPETLVYYRRHDHGHRTDGTDKGTRANY
jgi:glycosyltransferase involved in cell wall biosynthesis